MTDNLNAKVCEYMESLPAISYKTNGGKHDRWSIIMGDTISNHDAKQFYLHEQRAVLERDDQICREVHASLLDDVSVKLMQRELEDRIQSNEQQLKALDKEEK